MTRSAGIRIRTYGTSELRKLRIRGLIQTIQIVIKGYGSGEWIGAMDRLWVQSAEYGSSLIVLTGGQHSLRV